MATYKANVYSMSGELLRQQDLPDAVFGVEPNQAVMHQALVRQAANLRQGTHKTKTRGEICRTKAKWYRQKGTGRARHGARTPGLFVGGGPAHGPKPRSYQVSMPRKMRRLALRSALSAKAADDAIVLVEELAMEEPKTRQMRDLVDQICDGASTLVLLAERNDPVERSIRNLGDVRYLRAGYLNVRDLLGYDRVLMPLDAYDRVVAHLSGDSIGKVMAVGADDTSDAEEDDA